MPEIKGQVPIAGSKNMCTCILHVCICVTRHRRFNPYFCSEEAVALLFYVVVDDTGHLLLPDFETIDVHVVLDIFERPPESIHFSTDFHQSRNQLAGLKYHK